MGSYAYFTALRVTHMPLWRADGVEFLYYWFHKCWGLASLGPLQMQDGCVSSTEYGTRFIQLAKDVRTHPLMVLLAFISNISLFSLGSSSIGQERLPFFYCVRAFYSVGSFVPFNGGKNFWLVMMVLRWWQSHHCPTGDCQKLWKGWLVVISVFSLYRRRGAGYDRLPEVTWEGLVEHAFINNDGPRNDAKTFV